MTQAGIFVMPFHYGEDKTLASGALHSVVDASAAMRLAHALIYAPGRVGAVAFFGRGNPGSGKFRVRAHCRVRRSRSASNGGGFFAPGESDEVVKPETGAFKAIAMS